MYKEKIMSVGPFANMPEVPQINLGAAFGDAKSTIMGGISGAEGALQGSADSDGGFSLGGAISKGKTAIGGALSGAADAVGLGGIFGGKGGQNPAGGSGAGAQFTSQGVPDWRVKIMLPDEFKRLGGDIFKPLIETDNALVFPYAPMTAIAYESSYTDFHPTHSNYAFKAYQNSAPSKITLDAEFTVESIDEGKYWLAAKHFLLSAGKMAYGSNSVVPDGAPPPVLKLFGYGAHIWNGLSVVISNVTIPLPTDIDYMFIKDFAGDAQGTYVPIKSNMNITLDIINSRQKIKTFSLDSFIRGDYVNTGEFF